MEMDHNYIFNLSLIPWPNLTRPNVSTIAEVSKLGPLDMKTSVGQQQTLEILVKEFRKAMTEANLNGQWFLHAGALLGSIQHHDFIPWDDNTDFKLHIKHRSVVQAALKKLAPKLHTYAMKQRDKLFFSPFNSSITLTANSIGSHSIGKYPWVWPFIDISYFEEFKPNWGQDYLDHSRRYLLNHISPLTYRPFGKQWLPVPRRPVNFLKSYYGTKAQVCKSHFWSHATESGKESVVENCRKLMDKFPFVHRCRVPKRQSRERHTEMCDEYLLNGSGQVIHKIRLPLDANECQSPLSDMSPLDDHECDLLYLSLHAHIHFNWNGYNFTKYENILFV
nr:lipopolysaccharide choline [Hymenolepis microstoma]